MRLLDADPEPGMTDFLDFGKIKVVRGNNGGRFPFCHSIFVDDSTKVVIDPGAGREPLENLREHFSVDLVINTHFHFDHIAYNYLFEGTPIYLNDLEGGCYQDRREIADRLGMTDIYGKDWFYGWLERISLPDSPQSPYTPQNRHEWWLSTARIDGRYRWGDILDFGSVKMEVVGTPGHSEGFCCFFFPEQGLVYTGDIDLTAFGPFYFGKDGCIDLFIESTAKLSRLDAETFVTGHEVGVLKREDFLSGLDRFMNVIEERDQRILSALSEPQRIEDLSALGLIYGKKFLVDEWVRAWDRLAVAKHLERLVEKGSISCYRDRYSII